MQSSSQSRVSRDPVDATDRDAARRALRERRGRLAGAARAAADSAILDRLEPEVTRAAPRVIAGYWPMRHEPDIRQALARWDAAGIPVALPRVVAPAKPLRFVRWAPDAVLVAGPFGTLHPERGEELAPDLVILPCLGFDPRCYRLGYGGGYYDRTLAALASARAFGLAYDACEIDGFVAQAHDVALDAVITELRSLLRPAAG